MTDTPSPTFAGRRPDEETTADTAERIANDRLADEHTHGGARPPRERRADPDTVPVAGVSALDAIAAEVAAELEEELEDKVETWPVPGRPGYEVRYRCAVDYEELTAWQRKVTRPIGKGAKKRDVVNERDLARIILANRCIGIVRHGQDIVDGDAEPITFASPEFQDLLGATRAVEAVQKLYGRDSDIIAASAELLEIAGDGASTYDDEVGEVGAPTPT